MTSNNRHFEVRDATLDENYYDKDVDCFPVQTVEDGIKLANEIFRHLVKREQEYRRVFVCTIDDETGEETDVHFVLGRDF